MDVSDVGWIALWVMLNGGIGAALGTLRGQVGKGAIVSILLGPIGWFGVFTLPDIRPKCPECRGVVILGARRCKNCGADISTKSPSKTVNVVCPKCGSEGFVVDPPVDAEAECQDCHCTFAPLEHQAS